MQKRISDETKQLIQELYSEGLPVPEIARRAGISYPTAWGYTKANEKGFSSFNEYRKDWTKKRGFASSTEYRKYLAKRRQKNPENQELRNLIKIRLKKMGKNQSWLARQIGVSRESVSNYARGESIPEPEVLERLFSTLQVPYKTSDDLLI